MTVLVHTRQELAAALRPLPRRHFVATMGALHDGHAALVDAAGPGAIVSVFVNPLQFGAGEDLDRYPRTLAADVALCAAHGAAVVWAPSVDDVYVGGRPTVTVHAGDLGTRYEGASRPGHFDGMLTVVAKLFGIVRPDDAYFGQKDAQQLALVQRMVRDLDLGVRDPRGRDGARGRRAGDVEPQPLPHRRTSGPRRSRSRERCSRGRSRRRGTSLADAPGVDLDYVDLVDPETFAPSETGRLVVAARVGRTRLIDNAPVRVLVGV